MNKSTPNISTKKWGYQQYWFLGGIFLVLTISLLWCLIQLQKAKPLRLVVYGFSTQEEVLTQGIFPAFEKEWEAENGRDLIIEGVFGPSGNLVGQINLGAPADVAILSNKNHIDWLKLGKRVHSDNEPVLITSTPLVIVTRLGNPKDVMSFTDLAQPGLHLLHADPRSSGVGEWAVLAEYGSALLETGSRFTAERQLKDIWRNVWVVGSSARSSLTLFELGPGDALVTYEQDAFLARQREVPLEIIYPPRSMLTRHYAVIVDDNVTASEQSAAEALLDFILSDTGQQIFSMYFFRPAAYESEAFPKLLNPFTEEELGGWSQAYAELIENCWKTEIEPGLNLEPVTTFLRRGE
jgi:ABC-type sulfate transport system substrate-binding protein